MTCESVEAESQLLKRSSHAIDFGIQFQIISLVTTLDTTWVDNCLHTWSSRYNLRIALITSLGLEANTTPNSSATCISPGENGLLGSALSSSLFTYL